MAADHPLGFQIGQRPLPICKTLTKSGLDGSRPSKTKFGEPDIVF